VLPRSYAINLTESAKRKREEEKAQKENINKGISNYFTKGPVVAQPKAKVG
jgi:DNA polymerase alpha subunit A